MASIVQLSPWAVSTKDRVLAYLPEDRPPRDGWQHGRVDSTPRDARLLTLSQASQSLAKAVNNGDLQRQIVQTVLELTQAETVLLILLAGNDIVIPEAAGRYGRHLQGLMIRATHSLNAQLCASVEVTTLSSSMITRLAEELFLPDGSLGTALIAPIAVQDGIAGGVLILHAQADAFDANTLELIQLTRRQISIAWENAELIRLLRDQAEKLQRSQDAMVHNARMATIGRLTASLAHEINNPLQSIIGSVELVLEHTDPDWPQRPYLSVAAEELDRVSEIVQRMVGFYRLDNRERRPTQINTLLQETIILAEKQLQRNHIIVIFDLEEGLPEITLAPNQLKQVFLNMILNAIDAMPEGGQLQIATGVNGDVTIHISDTGHGIPANQIDHIFESFYTTKPHGTGLGLSISRDIIEASGGRISVQSKVGKGTTFQIVLPVSHKP